MSVLGSLPTKRAFSLTARLCLVWVVSSWLFPPVSFGLMNPWLKSNFCVVLCIQGSVSEQFPLPCLHFWYFKTSLKALKVANTQPKGAEIWGKHLPLHWKVVSDGVKIKQVFCCVSIIIWRKLLSAQEKARRQSDRPDPVLSWCQHAVDEYSFCVCVMCVSVCLSSNAWLLSDNVKASGTIMTITKVKIFFAGKTLSLQVRWMTVLQR